MDKAFILNEIKRTAAANGGQPLGMNRFAVETGVRVSEWKGVFWARWGDAVSEAGFAPNKLTEAFDASHILDAYARLATELGRLPTDHELRLKRHNDSSFPSNKCFDRFGGKAQLISRLREYCDGRDGYDNVLRWCESYTPPRPVASHYGGVKRRNWMRVFVEIRQVLQGWQD